MKQEGGVQVIPAGHGGSGGLDDLSTAAAQLLAKIGAIPFAEIGQNLNGTLHGVRETANGSQ